MVLERVGLSSLRLRGSYGNVMRFCLILLMAFSIGASGAGAAEKSVVRDAEGWARVGHKSYEDCEFKSAARAFSKALQYLPKNAHLHHWLGRSYAKMAEIANPLRASKDARNARASLERAVELEPSNHEYLRELFDFYLDSPEWMSGGLDKAAQMVTQIE